MKMYLDSSSSVLKLKLDDKSYSQEMGREMAKEILAFIKDKLQAQGKTWQDINEIHYFCGPGSFTGLRIGASVVNTLASELKIPLYNQRGEQLKLAIPEYGRPANISQPKK